MKRIGFALAALLAVACTPGAAPAPSPTTTVTAPTTVAADAGVGDCARARQHLDELECPPEEDAFGGWLAECTSWPNGAHITSCITQRATCLGTRQCLEGMR